MNLKNTRQQTVYNTLEDKDPTSPAIAYPPAVTGSFHDTQAVRSDEMVVGYKQTEVGVIPSEWSVFTIGELFEYLRTATNSRADLGDVGVVAYVHYGDIHTRFNHFIDFSRDNVPRLLPGKNVTATRLRDGDLIVTDASEDETGVCKSVEVRNLGTTEAVSGLHTFLLRPKDQRVNEGYRGYLLEKESVKKQLRRLTTGLKVFGVSKRALTDVHIPLPSTTEQRNISEVLSDVDKLLEALSALFTKKQNIRKTAMQQLLAGTVRLVGFSGSWETKPFGEIYKRLNGKAYQIQTLEYKTHGLHPVIDQGQDQVAAFSDRTDRLFKCPSSGVIIFGDHTRILKFVEVDFLIGADGVQLLTMQGGDVTRFFFYQLLTRDIPNTGYNRHFKYLRELTFMVPTLAEQQAIASAISDMDKEIVALERRLEKIRAVKQNTMQLLLTGRVRV